jgi:hypothetical protein
MHGLTLKIMNGEFSPVIPRERVNPVLSGAWEYWIASLGPKSALAQFGI